jgi:hypothetical protein
VRLGPGEQQRSGSGKASRSRRCRCRRGSRARWRAKRMSSSCNTRRSSRWTLRCCSRRRAPRLLPFLAAATDPAFGGVAAEIGARAAYCIIRGLRKRKKSACAVQVIAQLMCAAQHCAWIVCRGGGGCVALDAHMDTAVAHARRLLADAPAGARHAEVLLLCCT